MRTNHCALRNSLCITMTATDKKPPARPINTLAVPWLIAALVFVTIPHLPQFPIWLIALLIVLTGAKLVNLRYPKLRPGRILIFIITIISLAAVKLHYSTIFGRSAGISLLTIMLFLKLMETKSHRDGMVTVIMTYFSIITHFLTDQSIHTAIYMFFAIALTTIALISLNQGPKGISWKYKLRITVPLIIYSLPLMLLLFILFPRIPGPLWGLPEDAYSAKTGLSDEMSPGQISQLAFSDEVAFRVKFHGRQPLPHQLYWRALVFWEYDGRTWRPGHKSGIISNTFLPRTDYYSVDGVPFEYTVTLEPHDERWLFALDVPVLDNYTRYPGTYALGIDRSLQLRSPQPIISLSQYRLRSYPRYRMGQTLGYDEKFRALQLPAGSNPKTMAMAQEWRKDNSDPQTIINKALQLYSREFTYTLRPPVLGTHSIDQFLFDTKRGFCEHFAGSFVFLMRAAGVPARVVTGYQGGEINPLGDYMLIRQADAHAWSEVWLEEYGWTRVDPTTAVSPARVERGLDAALPARENPRFLLRRESPLLAQLHLVWDSINNRWNYWVLGYGPETQKLFLSHLGLGEVKAYNLVVLLTAGITIIMIVIAVLSLKRRKWRQDDKVQRVYLKLCQRLAKIGYPRHSYEGPLDYLQRVNSSSPALGKQLLPIIRAYMAIRYGENHNADSSHLKSLIKKMNLGTGVY